MGTVLDNLAHLEASIRAKVEHPIRVIKRPFGYVKVRYRKGMLPLFNPARINS